jgi:hypothetical protein
MDANAKNCAICGRPTPEEYQEKHHLVPKSRSHRKKHRKNEAEIKTILVCTNCGDQLHSLFSIHELENIYNNLETIIADERVQKWIKWIRKKKGFSVCVKTKKKR